MFAEYKMDNTILLSDLNGHIQDYLHVGQSDHGDEKSLEVADMELINIKQPNRRYI